MIFIFYQEKSDAQASLQKTQEELSEQQVLYQQQLAEQKEKFDAELSNLKSELTQEKTVAVGEMKTQLNAKIQVHVLLFWKYKEII